MTMRELDRLKCIQAVVDGELQAIRAAARLAMSPRQIRRLAQRYRLEGPVGLICRRCRRPSNNQQDRHDGAWLHALRVGAVRAQYWRHLCEHGGGQGARGTRPSDAAGWPGQGAAAARHLEHEAANAWMPRFIEAYNARFAKAPQNPDLD
jgi:Helix-turn-helix domain